MCNKTNMRIDRSWIGCVCHQRVCECRRAQQPSVTDMHLLAFEYSNKILIRQEQLDMVDDIMMQHRKNRPAIVHQAIMGCGKTSVICPLLALKLSDNFTSHRLVVVVCPPSLLLQTSKQLREKLCLVFKKRVIAFYFDRYFLIFAAFSLCRFFFQLTVFLCRQDADKPGFIESARRLVSRARLSRSILCATPSSIKCVFLKLNEILEQLHEKRSDAQSKRAEG